MIDLDHAVFRQEVCLGRPEADDWSIPLLREALFSVHYLHYLHSMRAPGDISRSVVAASFPFQAQHVPSSTLNGHRDISMASAFHAYPRRPRSPTYPHGTALATHIPTYSTCTCCVHPSSVFTEWRVSSRTVSMRKMATKGRRRSKRRLFRIAGQSPTALLGDA